MIKPQRKCSGKCPGTLVAVLVAVCALPAFAVSLETQLASAPYRADSGSVLIHCGALIDGRSDEVLNDVSVLIEEGRISRIANQIRVRADRRRADQQDCQSD